tara:strand:- start:510 stop:824 length:315 start_codon:yes stop_codon:yes gene_type:complete
MQDSNYPRYNIVEGSEGFKLEIAVPGWKKKDLSVRLVNNELRIKGSRSNEGGDPYLHQGLSTKSFDKVFVLNSDLIVEKVKLEDGLLTINIVRDKSSEQEITIS